MCVHCFISFKYTVRYLSILFRFVSNQKCNINHIYIIVMTLWIIIWLGHTFIFKITKLNVCDKDSNVVKASVYQEMVMGRRVGGWRVAETSCLSCHRTAQGLICIFLCPGVASLKSVEMFKVFSYFSKLICIL